MLEGKETPVGLVIEPDMDPWQRRLESSVLQKKGKKSGRKRAFRNGVTLCLSRIFRNSSASHAERPLVIYRGVEEGITVDQALDDELVSTLEEYPKFRPPLWHETSRRLRAVYYQRAIEILGGGYALSLNVSAHKLRKSAENGGLDYLYRSLRRHLNAALGRVVEFYVVLESACSKTQNYRIARPHLHGAIGCEPSERERVHKALRAFNRGASPEFFKARPAMLKSITDGFNWSQYCLKSQAFRRFALAGFPGPDMCCSQKLRSEARRLYEIDRETLLERIGLIKGRLASKAS